MIHEVKSSRGGRFWKYLIEKAVKKPVREAKLSLGEHYWKELVQMTVIKL